MKAFLAPRERKSVLEEAFTKFFDKFDYLDLVKSDFLHLAKFVTVDRFLIFLSISSSPIPPVSSSISRFFSLLLGWILCSLLSNI